MTGTDFSDVAAQLRALLDLTRESIELQKKILWEAATDRKSQDIIRLAQAAPILNEVQRFADTVQLGFMETVSTVRDEELSFARFGDGEFRLMLRPEYKLRFQRNSPRLSAELRDVLENPADGMLVGFPHVYRDHHWTNVWCDIWGQVEPIVRPYSRMGNSHVSRPVFFQFAQHQGVESWRAVWEGRSVCVITGKGSRFELLPELFDNCRSVTRVDSLPVDAFDDLERVEELALRERADIFLVSLGPAGTVLANRLARSGLRAIDIGHISDSYTNAFQGGAWPEAKAVSI